MEMAQGEGEGSDRERRRERRRSNCSILTSSVFIVPIKLILQATMEDILIA